MIVVPGYTLSSVIYSGNRTIVYRGIRLLDAVPVTIKTLQPASLSPENCGRLIHEYEISRDLNLDCAVKPLELLYCDALPLLVMEDFGGLSLKSQLPPDGMQLHDFLRSALQIARSLAALHAKQLIHRDVKPSNFIYNPCSNTLKITDFGISTQFIQEHRNTLIAESFDGSAPYMSPEQTGRMNRGVDYRSDLYSAGVSFYEMISGHLPFQANDQLEWLHCHIARQPAPLPEDSARVPAMVSIIINKLMAKNAEDRYQTAQGLLIDLERCLEQLTVSGEIRPFLPGREDISGRFQLSQRLYGRGTELQELMQTLERVRMGASELLLVTGHSGIGKSSFVRECHRPVVKQRGYFIAGKFEQYRQDIPYLAFIGAFSDLIRQLLTENDSAIAKWKQKLADSLETNAQAIADIIPDIRQLLHEPQILPELPPTESQNRLNLVFRQFVNVFAIPEHPLIIFIDDMQWADAASLQLMQNLLASTETTNLLIIGTCRDIEPDQNLLLNSFLNNIKTLGAAITIIPLNPLSLPDIESLIGDSMAAPAEQISALAKLLMTKTGGNPHFVNELLKSLHEQNLLKFNHSSGRWEWDAEKTEQLRLAANMTELIEERFTTLPSATVTALGYGACIGSRFTLSTLAFAMQKGQYQTALDLLPAVTGCFITADRSFQRAFLAELPDNITFCFIHDGIQQTAYSLIEESERIKTHIRVGKELLQKTAPEELESYIFEIANHFENYDKSLGTPDEIRLIAGLNMKAGEKALASNAYATALKHFVAAAELLGENFWQDDYPLASALHIKRLECELLCSNFAVAEELFDQCLKKLSTATEKSAVYNIKIVLCANLGRFDDAIRLGCEALRMFGIKLPPSPGKPAILLQYLKSRRLRMKRRQGGYPLIGDLARLPQMRDPERLAAMSILANISAPSYLYDKNLFALIAMMMVNQSLEHGNDSLSSFAYALYGMMIVEAFGEFDTGYEFGQMALALAEESGNVLAKGKTSFVFHNFVAHRKRAFSEGSSALHESYLYALRCGDLVYAGYSLLARILHMFAGGASLCAVISECSDSLDFIERVKNQDALLFIRVLQLSAERLAATDPATIINSDELLALIKSKKSSVPLQGYYLFNGISLYLSGYYEDALSMAEESENLAEEAVCQSYQADHYLFYTLAVTALWHTFSWSQQRRYKSVLNNNLQRLRLYASHCEANFRHKELIAEGEIARVCGAPSEALKMFEDAAMSAAHSASLQQEALANELAMRLHIEQKEMEAARRSFVRAVGAYRRWGAEGKIAAISSQHPQWCVDIDQADSNSELHLHQTASSASSTSGTLDIMTVMKVSQSISSEVELEPLLRNLTGFLIENAGASRGVLILKEGDCLYIEADSNSISGDSNFMLGLPVDGSNSIAASVVNLVARGGEHIVIDDAMNDIRFSHDRYVLENLSKSILCAPIVNQGKLTGILYLENQLVSGAFTSQRLKLLELLSAQIAISIENARLYARVKLASEKLEEQNRTLELRVTERTRELSDEIAVRKKAEKDAEEANRLKSDFLNTVSHELRTPLTSVLGFAHIIRKKLDDTVIPSLKPDDAKAARALVQIRSVTDIIVTEGERLTALIDDVLDLAKMEAGKTAWKLQPIIVSELVDRAMAAVSSLFEQKNIPLKSVIAADIPTLNGDRDRLIQVLVNLLSNAWKFTDSGAVTVEASHGNSPDGNRFVSISVSDSGIGICHEDRETIFEKFRQVGDTLTDKPKGTGLGLPICREIVLHHGGSIRVESQAGLGSTFIFSLPVVTIEGND